jgi:hypothetical protein
MSAEVLLRRDTTATPLPTSNTTQTMNSSRSNRAECQWSIALSFTSLVKNSFPDKHKEYNKGPVFDFAENTFSATSQTGRSFRDEAPACFRLPEQLMAFPEEVSHSHRDEAPQRSPPSCFIRKMQPQNVMLGAVATGRFL